MDPHTGYREEDALLHQLERAGGPAHAYLLCGPAGTGKRDAALRFAAQLLATGVVEPERAKARVLAESHPDLTCVAPSGAHEMLRGDIAEPVIAAASKTPFEAKHRVFILERVHTLNDEAANALLKTLEEPLPSVVMVLISERPNDVMPTILSRCQVVRFDPISTTALSERLTSTGISTDEAEVAARLALGNATQASFLASESGRSLRADVDSFVAAVLQGRSALERPWLGILALAKSLGEAKAAEIEAALDDALATLPKKEHRRCKTEFAERAKRLARRAQTEFIDQALGLMTLAFRDLAVAGMGAGEHSYQQRSEKIKPTACFKAIDEIDEARLSLRLNVNFELALEALSYRIEALVVG